MATTQTTGGLAVISRTIDGKVVRQRGDGYWDATQMCKAAGKKWADYRRLGGATEYIQAIAESTGIPVDSLVVQQSGRGGGTWVYENVALHLAYWCSPRFQVLVIGWVKELLATGRVEISTMAENVQALVAEAVRAAVAPFQAEIAAIRQANADPRALATRVPIMEMPTLSEVYEEFGYGHLTGKSRDNVRGRFLSRAMRSDERPIKGSNRKGAEWHLYGSLIKMAVDEMRREDEAIRRREQAPLNNGQRTFFDLTNGIRN